MSQPCDVIRVNFNGTLFILGQGITLFILKLRYNIPNDSAASDAYMSIKYLLLNNSIL